MTALRSRAEQPYEAALLSGVGGFLDAYAFLAHGGVFANAQTGNVVLLGVEFANHQAAAALRHIPPILAFVLGILTVEILTLPAVRRRVIKPTRVVLVTECVVFLIIGLLPRSVPNAVVTAALAWAATLQVGTFRKVGEVAYNTTFTTGNLRALVSAAFDSLIRRNPSSDAPARALAGVVVAFAAGAFLGGLVTVAWHTHAVIVVIPVLLLVLGSLILGTRRLAQPEEPRRMPWSRQRSRR